MTRANPTCMDCGRADGDGYVERHPDYGAAVRERANGSLEMICMLWRSRATTGRPRWFGGEGTA
jgi:hypothetical protein